MAVALRRSSIGYGGYAQPELEYETAPSTWTEWDILPRQQIRREERVRREQNERPRYQETPQTRARRRRTVINCLLVLVCFTLLSIVIAGHAAIASANLANISLQENITNLEEQVDKLSVGIANGSDITGVAARAESELGMGFPSASQIRYLSDESAATAQTSASAAAVSQDEAAEQGFFEEAWDTLKTLFS